MKIRYGLLASLLLFGCTAKQQQAVTEAVEPYTSVAYNTDTPEINCSEIKQEEGKDFKISDYCKVEGLLATTGNVDKNKVGKQSLILTATDDEGNITIRHASANITAKPAPTPEPEQQEQPSPAQPSTNYNYNNWNQGTASSGNSSSGNTGGSSGGSTYVPPAPSAPDVVATPVPEPSTPNYGFNTFGSYEACMAYMSQGHTGKCAAQADNMGNYTGLYMFIGN